MKKLNTVAAGLLLLGGTICPARAENWAHWRGPQFNGATTEAGLPAEFSKTNNVKWVANLPGPSAATPIIWDDFVFVSSTEPKSQTLRAICLDRKTGKELWNRQAGTGFSHDDRSNFASPSATTDGKLVYFYYGTGDLAAFDFSGKQIWSRNIQKDYGEFAVNWTYGTSPTLLNGKLYIQVLHRDVPVRGRGGELNDSYLLALDPATGKELWKHVRPSDARMESREAYSTPIVTERDGRKELLILGGDCVTAHDPETGKEIWRSGNYNPLRRTNWRVPSSPVAGGGVVLVCAPQPGSPVYAIKPGGKPDSEDSWLAWKSTDRETASDVCTPLFYKGKFYLVNGERRTISRIEPATGKVDWTGELGLRNKIESSPTGADDKIYFMDQRGNVFIVQAGDQFKLLKTIQMGDDGDDLLRASIAISHGNLFIRTGTRLYCVGK